MTEYELAEILHNNYDGLWQSAQMYFTLVSAYLVVAYLIGSKLSWGQNAVITGLYLVWVLGVVQAQYTTTMQTLLVSDQLLQMGSLIVPPAAKSEIQAGVYSFMVVQIAGILASLWFMWSCRHPRTLAA